VLGFVERFEAIAIHAREVKRELDEHDADQQHPAYGGRIDGADRFVRRDRIVDERSQYDR